MDNLFDGSVYGMVFGLNDLSAFNQFYVFWIDPTGQQYGLQKYDQGAWTNLTGDSGSPFVFSADVLTGNSVNVLKVRRQGAEILLFVNGVFLQSVNDNSFPTNGYVGVANWAGYSAASAVAYFDDFQINQSAVVFQDDYSQEGSGWFVGDADVCQAAYASGEYRTATRPEYLCLFRSPAGQQANGLLEAQVRREESIYSTAYGLFFGEDGSFSTFYAFLIIPDTQSYALAKYIDGSGWFGLTWDYDTSDAWLNSDEINPGTSTNQLAVEHDGTLFRIYVNGSYLGYYADTSPLTGGYFGVLNWSSQYDSAIADFDDFRLTAWEPGGGAVVQSASAGTGGTKALREIPKIMKPNERQR